MSNLYFTICGLFCSILLVVLFYSKDKIKTLETKLYGIMIVSSLIDTILVSIILLLAIVNFNPANAILIKILNKIDFIHYILWPSLAFLYTIYISYGNNYIYQKVRKIIIVVDIIASIIQFFLPIDLIAQNDILGVVGVGTNFVYTIAIIYIFLISVLLIINFRASDKHKFIPLVVLVLLLIVASIIRYVNPTLLVIPAILVYINLIMYFTIENPDIKMIEELIKAQKLSEKTNNDKSNFVYVVSEDIQNRLNNAEEVYHNVMSLNPNEEISYEMDTLKNVITGARNMLNSALGISNGDSKHLGLTNNKYNTNLLFNSIYTNLKQNVKDGIDFRLNITDDLPKELYGDSIKIKQILLSVLDNSIKYTDEGFIELRINSIIKNNICRLIISVEDSGKGIDIFTQNEIMNNTEDLNKEEINNLENKYLNLKTIRKIITIIGGTFTIDNNKYGGSTINISLDQKIVEDIKSKTENNIAKYSETIKNQKTCAIISTNKDTIKRLKVITKKENYKVEDFNICKNALDNIRNNVNYDVIFVDEFMEKIDARSLLNKVKEVDNFTGKLIVITKYKDIKKKKELINLGFSNVISIPIDKKDVISKLENL